MEEMQRKNLLLLPLLPLVDCFLLALHCLLSRSSCLGIVAVESDELLQLLLGLDESPDLVLHFVELVGENLLLLLHWKVPLVVGKSRVELGRRRVLHWSVHGDRNKRLSPLQSRSRRCGSGSVERSAALLVGAGSLEVWICGIVGRVLNLLWIVHVRLVLGDEQLDVRLAVQSLHAVVQLVTVIRHELGELVLEVHVFFTSGLYKRDSGPLELLERLSKEGKREILEDTKKLLQS